MKPTSAKQKVSQQDAAPKASPSAGRHGVAVAPPAYGIDFSDRAAVPSVAAEAEVGVVQQAQGRVRATMQMKEGVPVNDDQGLEHEADVMGMKALQMRRREAATPSQAGQQKAGASSFTMDDPRRLIQRKITVAGTEYPKSGNESYSLREFRKYLMLNLHSHKFKELGSKQMWKEINAWLEDDTARIYTGWDELLSYMWDQGWLDRKSTFGGSMGPKNLGTRPGFTTETTKAVPIDTGEHRRHVISSSSLGLAIEKSAAVLTEKNGDRNDRIRILNEWLARNNGSKQPSEHQALMLIWKIVHNHTGNLWAGRGDWNSAIGFIRPGIKNLMSNLDGTGTVKVAILKQKIAELKPAMGWVKDQWNEILKVLDETLSNVDPSISDMGIGAAYINWGDELKGAMGDKNAASELATDVYRAFEKEAAKTKKSVLPLKLAIECMNNVMATKRFVAYTMYKPIFIKWLNVYALGKDTITFAQARSIISDWVANCDLDHPYSGQSKEYYIELTTIYQGLFTPNEQLFDANGILDRFMKLKMK